MAMPDNTVTADEYGAQQMGRWWGFATLLLCACLVASNAQARALAVVSGNDVAYYQFVSALGQAVPFPGGLNVRTADQQARRQDSAAYDVIIIVGVKAARVLATQSVAGTRVFYAMVPERSYEWLERQQMLVVAADRRVLFLDQPPERYLALCEVMLPQNSKVGVLFSDVTEVDVDALARLARNSPIDIDLQRVAGSSKLVAALRQTLRRDDALLVLPDRSLYNSKTAKAVLLNAFRAGRPLLSYSRSFVRAGALAAVVSGPREMGRQAGELLTCMLADCDKGEATEYWPRYFTVAVNRTIAQRLGIEVPPETVLLEQIKNRTSATEGSR